MTLQQFIDRYKGKFWDFDKAYGAQCVDLFRFYVRDVMGTPQPKGITGAADFWGNYDGDPNLKNHFIKVPNTPTGVPKPGSVMIWNKNYGPFGHIAIVISADVNRFTALSQNDPLGQATILKVYTYKNIYGWLEPKEQTDMVEVDKATFEKLVTNSSRWDGVQALGYTSAAQIEQEIKDLKQAIKDKNAEIAVERQRAEDNRKAFNDLLARIAKALNTVQEINQVHAAIEKADADLDTLDDLTRQYAELQVNSKEQVEELQAEIARLKALKSSIDDATMEELIGALIKKLVAIIKK